VADSFVDHGFVHDVGFLEVTDSSFSPDVIGFSREFAVEICFFTSYSFYLVGVASVADRFLRFVVFQVAE